MIIIVALWKYLQYVHFMVDHSNYSFTSKSRSAPAQSESIFRGTGGLNNTGTKAYQPTENLCEYQYGVKIALYLETCSNLVTLNYYVTLRYWKPNLAVSRESDMNRQLLNISHNT